MRNFTLVILIACGLNIPVVSVSGRNYQGNTVLAFSWPLSDRLDAEINHLYRMRGHVRWQLNYYRARANPQIRRDFARISREIDHVNSEAKQRGHDRRHLRQEVERLRGDLHDIETRLHIRKSDYYQWQ
jgi:hypothetical protein